MHQNLLRLILTLIGKREKQRIGWPSLGPFSQASIEHFVSLKVLDGPFERDFVIDPRYGTSPLPVTCHDGVYYLASTDPDGPDPVEIERDWLREYNLDTGRFLEALARANDMEALVEMRASGLWQLGLWQHGQDEWLVLFAPARFSGQVSREVAEAEKLVPAGRTLLLVPFRACIDGEATELDERRVVTVFLENSLDVGLKVQLPDRFFRARLQLDCARRLMHWDGQLLRTRDSDFPILEKLARHTGGVVSQGDLVSAGGQQRSEESVRKSIMYLRDALCKADPALSRENVMRIIRTVQGAGYQLSLPKSEVRII